MSNETQTETIDEKYAEAVALCEKRGRVSAALIQRGLGISYIRAAKIEAAIKANAVAKPVEETAGGATVVTDAPADVSEESNFQITDIRVTEPAPTVPDVLAAANLADGEHDLPVALIRESEKNTRTDFAREGLLLLSDTLADEQIGQVKPIDVYRLDEPDANGCVFELLDGARRFRAAKLGERTHIRARIVPAGTEADRLVRRLMANTGEPLNPIDLGEACVHLLKHCNGDKRRAAKLAGFGEDGVRVFEQTMQRVTDLIPPVLQALRDGRITKSHADLLCRVDAKHQNEMLEQCFEPRNVFNGANHEMLPTLISEKELRGKIASRFPKEENKQGKLFEGSTNGVAKDKNDLDREHQQKLEDQADGILAGAEWPTECELCFGDIGQVRASVRIDDSQLRVCLPCYEKHSNGSPHAARGPNPSAKGKQKEEICDVCGVAPAIGVGEGNKKYCQGCHTKKVLANEKPESDYEADSAKRVERMARALESVKAIPPFGPAWLTRIALAMCPPHVNNAVFCKVYGQGLTIGRGNNVVWDEETEGTLSEYIQSLSGMATADACFHLRRCILVFLALPAQNPAYPDDVLTHIEQSGRLTPDVIEKMDAEKKPEKKTGTFGKIGGKEQTLGIDFVAKNLRDMKCRVDLKSGRVITPSGDEFNLPDLCKRSKFQALIENRAAFKVPTNKSVKNTQKISGAQIKKNVAASKKSKLKPAKKKAKK